MVSSSGLRKRLRRNARKMDFRETFDAVTLSPVFREWHAQHPDSFLCGFFCMMNVDEEGNFQVDFYNPSTDTISSFIVVDDKVVLSQDESKIFKQEDSRMKELDVELMNIGDREALALVQKLQREKYPQERFVKFILVGQAKNAPLWNVNAITASFRILHVKIDAQDGSLLEEDFKNPLSFSQSPRE